MQLINDMFHWWYISETITNSPNGLIIGMYSAGILGSIVWIIGCLIGEWKTEFGVVGGFFAVGLVAAFVGLLLAIGGPVVVLLSIVIGFGYALQAIGDFWRNSVKDKETKRTKALAELISSDPAFKAQYEELMKQTPEI